jgi:glutamyl-tRNA reductase
LTAISSPPLPVSAPPAEAAPRLAPPSADPAPLQVVGIASSLGSTSIQELELRVRSIRAEVVRSWLAQLEATEEVAVLLTCHRVEIVLLVRGSDEVDRWLELLPGTRGTWEVRHGWAEIHHLFRVAAGRESLALGEVEVRHQVRSAARTVESRHPRRILAGVLSAAARSAEEVAPAGPPAPSVATVASAALLDLLDRPFPRILIVGAGTVARQVAERLSPAADVTVIFHRQAPTDGFVHSTGVRVAEWDQLATELQHSDGVVTAVKSGIPCISATWLPRDHPVVLMDLGVPRNIDPEVRGLPNIRLVDLEELHARSGQARSAEEVDRQVEARAKEVHDDLGRQLMQPWIDTILRRAEEVRRAELAQAGPFLGSLRPEQQAAVDRLTQHLVERLLIPPTQRVQRLPAGTSGDRQRRWALELLSPGRDDP